MVAAWGPVPLMTVIAVVPLVPLDEGSLKFGGNSCPSGGSRENAGGASLLLNDVAVVVVAVVVVPNGVAGTNGVVAAAVC